MFNPTYVTPPPNIKIGIIRDSLVMIIYLPPFILHMIYRCATIENVMNHLFNLLFLILLYLQDPYFIIYYIILRHLSTNPIFLTRKH